MARKQANRDRKLEHRMAISAAAKARNLREKQRLEALARMEDERREEKRQSQMMAEIRQAQDYGLRG
jgi:hypothetical protein